MLLKTAKTFLIICNNGQYNKRDDYKNIFHDRSTFESICFVIDSRWTLFSSLMTPWNKRPCCCIENEILWGVAQEKREVKDERSNFVDLPHKSFGLFHSMIINCTAALSLPSYSAAPNWMDNSEALEAFVEGETLWPGINEAHGAFRRDTAAWYRRNTWSLCWRRDAATWYQRAKHMEPLLKTRHCSLVSAIRLEPLLKARHCSLVPAKHLKVCRGEVIHKEELRWSALLSKTFRIISVIAQDYERREKISLILFTTAWDLMPKTGYRAH